MPKPKKEPREGFSMAKVLRGEGMSATDAERLSSTIQTGIDWKPDPNFYEVLASITGKLRQPPLPNPPTTVTPSANPDKIRSSMHKISKSVYNRSDGRNRTAKQIRYHQAVL